MNTNKVQAISELIAKNQRVFKIPVYQRNYDWGTGQCKKLFDDILKICDNEKKHFLGTFVYIKGKIDNSNLTEVLVIDGQQRLTTLYLLLKALLDCSKEHNKLHISSEIEEYIYNRRCPEECKVKLKPIQSDNIELQKLMYDQPDEMLPSSNIIRNYQYFKKLIEERLEDYDLSDILYGMKQLEMVEIILDKSDGDDPQEIFESINSTGLELTLADLIRNFLLMDVENQERLFQGYWLKIESQIGYEEIEEFLLQYLNTKILKNITKKNAYEMFKWYYNNHFQSHEEMLIELYKYSKYYANFIGKKSSYTEEIKELLKSFQVLKQTTMYPFLFRIFEDYEDNHLQYGNLIEILQFLKSYSIRRIVCEIPSNSLRGLYKGLYDRIYRKKIEDEFAYAKLVKLISELKTRDKIPSDEEFKEALLHHNLYKKSACKYILSEIENQKKEKLDISNLTIEHILPQKQNTSVWKQEIGEEYEKVYGTYLHTLGNLTISGYNSELGTKSFAEKKELIKQHSKANILNADVLSASVWNEETIKNRANRLADIVCRLFDYKRIVLEEHSKEEFFNIDQCDNYVNTKPYKFIFLGEEVEVSYYTEMLNIFLHLLYDNQPELLEKLAKQEYKVTSSDKIYMSYDSSTMRKPQQIENTDIFYESNLSAEYIMIFIKSLLMDSPYDIDDFTFGMKYISD